MLRQFIVTSAAVETYPVVRMGAYVGIEGHYYLHPAACIDLRTGEEVTYSECGWIVDADHLSRVSPGLDIPCGDFLLPQADLADLREHLKLGKQCYDGPLALFNAAVVGANMRRLRLIVVYVGEPGVGKTKLLVTHTHTHSHTHEHTHTYTHTPEHAQMQTHTCTHTRTHTHTHIHTKIHKHTHTRTHIHTHT
jgi:hypothetical protein